MAVEIYIGNSLLDFNDDLSCVFSAGDIRDITEGSQQSSYEITAPLTANNKQLLKYSNELNVFDEVTDEGRVLFDGSEVLRGTIKVLNNTQETLTFIIQGTAWIDHFKDLDLKDLDLSAYNYSFTEANVIASWSGSGKFYRYPMIDFGRFWSQETGATANRYANDFVPVFRVIDILAKIFSPWTLVGDWLTDAAELYMLGDEPVAEDEYITDKSFHASPSSAASNQVSKSFGAGATDILTFADAKINMFDDRDDGNNYNNLTNIYTIPEDGTYNFHLDVVPSCVIAAYMTILGQEFRIRINRDRGGVVTILQETDVTYVSTDLLNGITYALDTGWIHLLAGDKIYATCFATTNMTNTDSTAHTITFYLTTVTTQFQAILDRRCCYAGIDKTIVPAEYMPSVSQMDFVKAIKEACGIRFYPDLLNKTIRVDTSDDCYTSNEVVLNNVDYSELPETEFISSNYKSVLRLKLIMDSNDNAIKNYLKTYKAEPYGKDIALSSVYTETGIEIYENSLFGFTVSGGPNNLLRIFGDEEYVTNLGYPAFRAYGYTPRLITWSGLTAGTTWYLSGVSHATFPKAVTLDMNNIYNANLIKTYHLIDKGKIIRLQLPVDILMVQQFVTVINNYAKEGFRPIYKFTIGAEAYGGYLNQIEFNNQVMLLELILLH